MGTCWQEVQPQGTWREPYYTGLAVPDQAGPKPYWPGPVNKGQQQVWSGVTQGLLFLEAH